METVFSSAFLLYVIDSVSPGFVSDQTWLATALGILDMMIARGSPAAPLRKRELQRLEQAMTSYLSGSTSHGSASPSQGEERAGTLATEEGIQANEAGLVDDDLSLGFLAADGGLAMSPGEMMHLAEGLRMEDFVIFP